MNKFALTAFLALTSFQAAASQHWFRIDFDAIHRGDTQPFMYCEMVLSPEAYARQKFGSKKHEVVYSGSFKVAWDGTQTAYLFAGSYDACLDAAREFIAKGSLNTKPHKNDKGFVFN